MTPEKRTPARWQLYATRLAWDKLRSARRLLDQGSPGFRVRADLEGALMWAIEAWLRRRGIRPDHANGWLTTRAQFYGAAPEGLADRVRACEERLLSFGPGLHPPTFPRRDSEWDSPRWPQASRRCTREVQRLLLQLLGNDPDTSTG